MGENLRRRQGTGSPHDLGAPQLRAPDDQPVAPLPDSEHLIVAQCRGVMATGRLFRFPAASASHSRAGIPAAGWLPRFPAASVEEPHADAVSAERRSYAYVERT
jgi:hypothetical protein